MERKFPKSRQVAEAIRQRSENSQKQWEHRKVNQWIGRKKSEENCRINKLLPGNSWKSNLLRWLVWYFQQDDNNSGTSRVFRIKVSISKVHPLHTDKDMDVPSKQRIWWTERQKMNKYTEADILLIHLQFYTHIALHGYGLGYIGYRISQYDPDDWTIWMDGHPMDIRCSTGAGERALQQDEPRAATIKVISQTAKVRPWHVVTCDRMWFHDAIIVSHHAFGSSFKFLTLESLKIASKKDPIILLTWPMCLYEHPSISLTWPRECFGLNAALKCHENHENHENQWAMCQKKRWSKNVWSVHCVVILTTLLHWSQSISFFFAGDKGA